MKHLYQGDLKPFLQKKILESVKEMGLTMEQTAELLGVDVRSYAYLRNGRNMCSASTLILYLTKMCSDPVAFVEAAKVVIQEAEEKM